ncbi:MAG: hypothetical protein A2Z21_09135 [Candidatus Fraserbacteria bacterium RBG_16_55_9]|uniref:Uncharacterized protein n=1 Tax=Fraserbacteria sp. (strain RBG_16_55_9) TaxID=1817864 RepID=A0A1F5UUI1_FRAXR|nr:MAG: hypothetical protein A2Z21_09135 [Candidatus Fraserbacteria bacterium RBG_16_55_9]
MAEFFLDASIPMYASGREHPYKRPCVWIMTEITEGRLEVAIDTEIVQEILYRYGALQQWAMGAMLASNLLDIVPVVYPIQLKEARRAIQLFQQYGPQGVTARDVIHVAGMQNNGLTQILSTDAHFDLVKEVKRLDPKALLTKKGKNKSH